jgi:hypothetical protein
MPAHRCRALLPGAAIAASYRSGRRCIAGFCPCDRCSRPCFASAAQECRTHVIACSQWFEGTLFTNGINRSRTGEKAPALVPVRAGRFFVHCQASRSRLALEPARLGDGTYSRIGGNDPGRPRVGAGLFRRIGSHPVDARHDRIDGRHGPWRDRDAICGQVRDQRSASGRSRDCAGHVSLHRHRATGCSCVDFEVGSRKSPVATSCGGTVKGESHSSNQISRSFGDECLNSKWFLPISDLRENISEVFQPDERRSVCQRYQYHIE